jgi:hypothetical protein
MNELQNDALDRALDAKLERTLAPPQVPPQFRARLQAALVRAEDSSLSDARARLEREQRERLMELKQNYVRLQRRTLGVVIGGAFAAGAAAVVVLPWVTAQLGPIAPLVIASAGAAVGIWIGVASWSSAGGEFDSRELP